MSQIKKMQAQNHLPHALLITGAEKVGKFQLMQEIVGRLIGDDDIIRKDLVRPDKDHPETEVIRVRRSNYQNLIYCRAFEVEKKNNKPSKNILVNQIRDFCDTLNKTADKLQIGVIFYADEMTDGATNSLLKTLEEPRKNTLIILLAHHLKNLPLTIISRCQTVHIAPDFAKTEKWLATEIGDEAANIDLKLLLENAHYAPFKALADFKSGDFVEYQKLQEMLIGIALDPHKISFLPNFKNIELKVLDCLENLLIKVIRLKVTGKNNKSALDKVIDLADLNFLLKLQNDIFQANNLAKTNVNMALLLDDILIVWSHITNLKNYPKITFDMRDVRK